MKKNLILMCAFIAMCSIQAQNAQKAKPSKAKDPKITMEQKVDKEVSKMKTDLNLTSEQEAKVRIAATQKFQSMELLEEEYKEKRKNIDSTYKASINETLTVSQLKVKSQVRKANLKAKNPNKSKN